MNYLIIYASKHGSTEKCAKKLASKLDGLVDFLCVEKKGDNNINIDKYDKIIIGGPIYFGRIPPYFSKFCFNNMKEITGRPLGLFICGLFKNKFLDELTNSFPEELIDSSKCKEFFGGEICFNKLGFFEKLITKAIKKDFSTIKIDDDAINSFANIMNRI